MHTYNQCPEMNFVENLKNMGRISTPSFQLWTFMCQVHALVTLVLLAGIAFSQSTVKFLPGFSGELPFTLENGYQGIGDLEDLQLFYYFIESERSPQNDPLLLWLTGGPCCSSVSGLLLEIGPVAFDYSNSSADLPPLVLNPYSWTKVASIIFLDAPVGTGFSYSISSKEHGMSDTLYAAHIYQFLQKWLMSHPKFIKNPLYLTGDSYSGKIIPITAQEIYLGNEVGRQPQINLKGYVLGNPVTNTTREHMAFIEFGYRMGLLSDRIYESAKRNCRGEDVEQVNPNNVLCVKDMKAVNECFGNLFKNQILLPKNCHPPPSGNPIRILERQSSDSEDKNFKEFLPIPLQNGCQIQAGRWLTSVWGNKNEVKKALKVREGTKTTWTRCNRSISYTMNVQSSVYHHRNLTNTFLRALIYSGDHDMVVPYFSTIEWIESLGLPIENDWRPWFSDNHEVLGYTMKYTNKRFDLTFATVKGGGHTTAQYLPKECFTMLDRWLAYNSL